MAATCVRSRQKSLREQIGLVSQDTFLFHDTIFKNIQFGRLDATEEEIYAAARDRLCARLHHGPAQGLRDHYWRQGLPPLRRTTAAPRDRARLLKNAPILLLDEATSALDSESEQQIQLALERLAEGPHRDRDRTPAFHHPSADQIVVMEKGRIKEIGNHAELLENSGYYRRLYDLQFNRNPEEPGAEVELFATASA